MEIGLGTGSIQAWVAAQTKALYDDLKVKMNEGDQRNAMVHELNELKQDLARTKESWTNLNAARQHLQDIIDKYPGLEDTLGRMLDDLTWETSKYEARDKALKQMGFRGEYDDGERKAISDYVAADGKWGTALDGAIDGLRQKGQTGLIEVQDLNSKLQQAQQLGSNMLATLNQTNLSIIANLK